MTQTLEVLICMNSLISVSTEQGIDLQGLHSMAMPQGLLTLPLQMWSDVMITQPVRTKL
jgi:hypothetical protein